MRNLSVNARSVAPVRNGTAALPSAYATHVKSWYNAVNVGKNRLRVSGCDLVYRIPDTVTSNSNQAFVVIPSNPAYWTGTRVASIASTYSNYRPIKMSFHYVPQVSVTTPGTVVMGTLWNQGSQGQSLQQTLLTSNGGLMCQCYIPSDTRIDLTKALPQNNFYMAGPFNRDTNPFLFMAVMQGTEVVPGYFFVSYQFDFWNPIGESWTYTTLGPVSINSLNKLSANTTAVLTEQDPTSNLGPGTTLIWSGSAWLSNDRTVLSVGNPGCYAYNSSQSSVFGQPNVITPTVETIEITPVGLVNQPIITRKPGTEVQAGKIDLWTRIKGGAGKFVRKILIPCAEGAITTLMNPENRKAIQLCWRGLKKNSSGGPSSLAGYGFNFLNFSSLADNVKEQLAKQLGVTDVTKLTDLLVNNTGIVGAKAISLQQSQYPQYGDEERLKIETEEFGGFKQDTNVDSENVVCSRCWQWLGKNAYTGAAPTYYIMPNGEIQYLDRQWTADEDGEVTAQDPVPANVVRFGVEGFDLATQSTTGYTTPPHSNTAFDLGYQAQQSFIQPYEYTGNQPTTTQEFYVDQYEAVVDECVDNVTTGRGTSVGVGAGLLADVSRKIETDARVNTTINNYAANNQTINNEWHLQLLDTLNDGQLRSATQMQLMIQNQDLNVPFIQDTSVVRFTL